MTTQPPVRRRLIGGALRYYRENMGYTLEDASRTLECDRSKISRIETGQRGIRPRELRELLHEYGVPDSERAALMGLASRGGAGSWLDRYKGVLRGEFAEYLIAESAASEVMVYQYDLVPGLLQTADYARAITGAQTGALAASQADELIAARAARQQAILGGGDRRVTVIMGEAALRQQVGGQEVMAAQLTRLAELAGGCQGLTLQVLPFTAGAHPAAGTGPHAIVRFPQAPGLGVVYVETLSGGCCLLGPQDVTAYSTAFTLLREGALSSEDTARLLHEAAEELRPPWD